MTSKHMTAARIRCLITVGCLAIFGALAACALPNPTGAPASEGAGTTVLLTDVPPATTAAGSGLGPVVMRQTAPDVSYLDAAGNRHLLSESKGKFVLLVFYAHYCPVCKREVPHTRQFTGANADKAATMVAIEASSVGQDLVNAFAVRAGVPSTELNHDPTGVAARAYSVAHVPTVFVISPDFVAQESYVGLTPTNFYESMLALYGGNPSGK